MTPLNTFHSVDAPAGSGKTYQALRWALTQAAVHHQKTVIIFKSIELLRQAQRDADTFQRFSSHLVAVRAIHSKSADALVGDYSVSAALAEHLSQSKQGKGEILMITEAALLNQAHWPNRSMWVCICDEIPAVAPAHKLNIPDNHRLLTDHLQLGPDIDGYTQVLPTESGKATLLRYAENPNRDEINAVLSSMAQHIVSPYFETYVKTSQFERVKSGEGKIGAKQIEMFSLLQPTLFGTGEKREFIDVGGQRCEVQDAFADVILMGASFQSSLLGLIWPHMDLQISDHSEISRGLRYIKHSCGSRLTISHLFEVDWSKEFRRGKSFCGDVEHTNLSLLVDAVAEEFPGDRFAYLANKDIEELAGDRFEPIGGQQLPNAPWGLNTFQHLHNVGILSALNPTPAHLKFLNHMGLDGDAVREALYHSQVYQAVMRCSLRDVQATHDVQVILPDRKCAEAIGEMFPGCTVKKLDRHITEKDRKPAGRPKLARTKNAAMAQRETRQRNRAISKEIKRIEAGGAADDHLIAKFQRECRSDNKRLIRLEQVILEKTDDTELLLDK